MYYLKYTYYPITIIAFIMTTRRSFLRNSSLLALATFILKDTAAAKALLSGASPRPIGLQLYTVNKLLADDLEGTLQKIAAIGYKELESAGSAKGNFYGLKPAELAKLVSGLGMHWRSAHVGGAPYKPQPGAKPLLGADGKPFSMPALPNLRDNYQQLVDAAAEGGISYLVCSSTPIGTLDEVHASIDVLNKTGAAAKAAGVTFAYHNHYHEFTPIDGQLPYDLILGQTDANLVKMELDLAWATKGGQDPVALFQKNPGRFPLWHTKDLSTDHNTPVEVGKGIVDFKRIFAHADTAGLQYFFVEQDNAPQPLEDIQTSYTNLTKIVG